MLFKIGDKVTVKDEDLEGEVISVLDNWVVFISEDGFEYTYPVEALFSRDEDSQLNFTTRQWDLEPKEEDKGKIAKGLKPINLSASKPAIDLHMEELLPDRLLAKNEIAIEIQLAYAEKVLNKAIALRKRNLVFIHGQGSGTLRDELRGMIRDRFPNAEFFDGNYQKYGWGATEVILHGLGGL